MRARRASAEDKAELWPHVVAAYKGYGSYQRRTERDIPLVISAKCAECSPRPASAMTVVLWLATERGGA